MGDSAVERLLALRQHQKDGRRSPHKPLLVLLALGRFASTGSSALAWSEAEQHLGSLLAEFGPGRQTSPAYPFTRLRTDRVWQLSRDVPNDTVGPLNEAPVEGRFTAELEAELQAHPELVGSLARALVDSQFPETVAGDVLLAVGLDPALREAVVLGPASPVRRRSPGWREAIVRAWDAQCAFCGFDGSLSGAPVGIEAAHVRWFTFDGPDDLDNGLALCSLDHKLFDRGVLGLRPDGVIEVSDRYRATTEGGREVYRRHGIALRPRPRTRLPAERHIAWHRSEVFRGEPLAV